MPYTNLPEECRRVAHRRSPSESAHTKREENVMKEKVEASIEKIRPMLQADGGDIKLVSIDEGAGKVTVALQGSCAGCPHAAMTLKMGVEARLKEDVPEVKEIVAQNL